MVSWLRGHKPKWLYEALPTIYVCSGFGAVVLIPNPASFISGVLFTCAGLLVFKMRRV